jgi:hypothetical protein
MMAASVWLDRDLTFMDPGFPENFNLAAFPAVVAAFTDYAEAIVYRTPPQDIINKVFEEN